MMWFLYDNIHFEKDGQENWLVVAGEITNESGKNYHAVVFRVILFVKTIPVGNVTVAIKGFYAGQTRTFQMRVGELDYNLNQQICRYEIYPESAY